eukprot:GHRQ01004872.1.p2 GENE.GHRQ01004872.1~~GHRQ01004872.1.p2  ORF type:complete len:166 (+),score=56.83 GHRQ01004872.1:209-706(+)
MASMLHTQQLGRAGLASSSTRQRQAMRVSSRRVAPCCATESNQEGSPSSSVAEEEARIEALEARLRKGGKPRQIPIRNMTPKQQQVDTTRAEWKEGKLFPEGWERMSAPEKVAELYLGQRGMLFWANKAAWAAVWVVGGAWVLFRFVGPAVGLYKLQGDLMGPPL